jgi:glycosyltransferase involved in cell wall biosynthesis
MKIAIITNSLSGGGAESSMRLINKKLRLMGEESTLLCLNRSEGDVASEGEVLLDRKWNSGLLQTIRNFKHFTITIKRINPDSVIVNCELPELYVAFIPQKIKKLICVEHTSKPWAGRLILGFLVRILLAMKKAIWITVNKSKNDVWPLKSKAIYLPNPVEVPQLSVKEENQSQFIFIGRLRKEKGIEIILEAISSERKNIDVYGSGDLESHLKALYSEFASFHGFVENPWKHVSPNQILIVASEYEGDGKVVVEGILAGVPILLLDNPDLRKFNLPERNYFSNFEDLKQKLRESSSNVKDFTVDPTRASVLKKERDALSITRQWKTILV